MSEAALQSSLRSRSLREQHQIGLGRPPPCPLDLLPEGQNDSMLYRVSGPSRGKPRLTCISPDGVVWATCHCVQRPARGDDDGSPSFSAVSTCEFCM